jgi:hypothetical protein
MLDGKHRGQVAMRKYWLIIVLTVVAAIGAGGYLGLQGPLLYGRIGVTYAAKQTCSCMFISGRSLASCQTDLPGGAAGLVRLSVAGRQVRANAYGLVSASATFEDNYGCRIDS